jgi:hypothetical protein
MMKADLSAREQWLLSGSITNWGNELIPFFDLVVFVYVPPELRIERLRKREQERYGDRMLPGGDRYEAIQDFLAWAAVYDAGTRNGRSLPKHEKWLSQIECPAIRIVNDSLETSVEMVLAAIADDK